MVRFTVVFVWLGTLLSRRLLSAVLGRGGRRCASVGVGVLGLPRSGSALVRPPTWCLPVPPASLRRPLPRLGFRRVLRRRRPLRLGIVGGLPGRWFPGPWHPVGRFRLCASLFGLPPRPLSLLSPGMRGVLVRWVGGGVSGRPLSGLLPAMPLPVGWGATTMGGGLLPRASLLVPTMPLQPSRIVLCGSMRLGLGELVGVGLLLRWLRLPLLGG